MQNLFIIQQLNSPKPAKVYIKPKVFAPPRVGKSIKTHLQAPQSPAISPLSELYHNTISLGIGINYQL